MDDFLIDSGGSTVEPTWSKRDDTWFGSFGATPDSIPHDALKYKTPLPYLLKSTTPSEVLAAMDYSKAPVWYNPEEHWLPWIPLGRPNWSDGEEDPLAYLFDIRPVPTQVNHTLMYGTGSDSDDPMEPKEVFAGYLLEEDWQSVAKFNAELLYGICSILATTTSWYDSNRWTGTTGDVPRKVEETTIAMVYSSEDGAQNAGTAIKRSTLSCVGFIAWFQTLVRLEDTALHKDDQDYIRVLRLNDRPKTGVLYSLSRDLHEANFPHLIAHRVPIHVAWTEEEKGNWRFLRLSPEVWGEYTAVRSSKAPGEMITLADLPSGAAWKSDWDRSDWFFQNKYAGKRGDVISGFQPTWDYAIIDFHLWGARPPRDDLHLLRQNPLRVDEPPFDRIRPDPHVQELESFSLMTDNERVEENDIFYERTEVAREQHKNLHAPRPTRNFNSFNGAREVAPLDKSLRGNVSKPHGGRRQRREEAMGRHGAVPPLRNVWAPSSRDLPRDQFPAQGRRREQGSLQIGPARWPGKGAIHRVPRSRSLATECTMDSDNEGGDFAREYAAASTPEDGEVGDTPASAVPEVERRSSTDHPFAGPSPFTDLTGLFWNQEWLEGAILVCDDERTYWRLKTYAAVFKGFTKFEEILEVAIRMALPFAVYIKRSDVRKFSRQDISPLDLKTLGSLYAPGYVDLPLVWTGPGGGPAVYGQYEGRVGSLLSRPEAVAFVPLGGSTAMRKGRAFKFRNSTEAKLDESIATTEDLLYHGSRFEQRDSSASGTYRGRELGR
ncbi:hypothetical protein B0H13DRAFT_2385232 [Mycena leptocephala]|nr:hypothetical protein B0H13DRAFT_2385232 [Mycena leptocephala]